MCTQRTSADFVATGGTGSRAEPRKNETLTYLVKQWTLRNQPSPSTP